MLTINVIIHDVMKISYFSQSFIHDEFIISLLPLESGFVLLFKIQARMVPCWQVVTIQPETYAEPCQTSKIKIFAQIVNG